MAYCPEDGEVMEVEVESYHICYTCPRCNSHWLYQEGLYEVVDREECPNCIERLVNYDLS